MIHARRGDHLHFTPLIVEKRGAEAGSCVPFVKWKGSDNKANRGRRVGKGRGFWLGLNIKDGEEQTAL
jgi:hypothetical protein